MRVARPPRPRSATASALADNAAAAAATPVHVCRQGFSQDVFGDVQAAGRDVAIPDLAEEGRVGEAQAEGLGERVAGLFQPCFFRFCGSTGVFCFDFLAGEGS